MSGTYETGAREEFIRIVQQGIRVRREIGGVLKTITPKIGQPFAFFRDEIAHLEAEHPAHIRHPRNESGPALAALPLGPSENVDKGGTIEEQNRIPPVNTGRTFDAARQSSATQGTLDASPGRPGKSAADVSDL